VLAVVVAAVVGYALAARSRAFSLSLAELRERHAGSESRYIDIQDIELHYRDEGTGPTVLLLHGSFGSLRQYDEIVARLEERHRLVRFDIPAVGLSGPIPDEAIARGLRVEDVIAELLDRLRIGEVPVYGVSSGASKPIASRRRIRSV
jgi:hypothetical protein